ncbi:MAG: major capsid family protein [Cypionkella sp.]|nr:major capsid family protein [Cypionkella sp.]
MSKQMQIMDAPIALGHVISQQSHIEAVALKRKYPQFKYRERVFVDTSPNAYAASVTFFVQDQVGKAKFLSGKGDDIPMVDILKSKFEQGILDGGVGYSYSFTEIGQAAIMGTNLSSEGAIGCARGFSSFLPILLPMLADTAARG